MVFSYIIIKTPPVIWDMNIWCWQQMRVEGQADTGGSKWRDRFKLDCSFWKNADGVLVIVDVCGLFFLRLKHCTDKVNPDPAGKKKKRLYGSAVCSEWFRTGGLIKADGRWDQTRSHPGRISVLCNGRELKDFILPAPFEVLGYHTDRGSKMTLNKDPKVFKVAWKQVCALIPFGG